MARFQNPVPQFLDSAGKPYIDGQLTFYKAGGTTPQDTFNAPDLLNANTNPVELLADGRTPEIWLKPVTYNVLLSGTDSVTGVLTQTWQRDNVGSDTATGQFGAYSPNGTYDTNDITQIDGKFYISLQNGNKGNDPATSPTFWNEIILLGVWNTAITYAITNLAIGSDGNIYRALVAGSGNDPISDKVNWIQAVNLTYINGTSLEATSVRQAADVSVGTGTHTADYAVADMEQITATGDFILEFDNFVTGAVSAYVIDAVNWGAHTVTLPAGILYASGTPPAFTVAGTDRFLFLNDKDDVLTLHVVGQALAV